MMDVIGISYRFISDLLRAFWSARNSSAANESNPTSARLDDLATRALTTVFGMDDEGRIKKEKARRVVEKLGLIEQDNGTNGFELLGSSEEEEEVRAEVLVGDPDDNELRRGELLHQAFTVFDEDGDGFIEALEVKRVLECLGLADGGWDIGEFEKMVEVVDLNFDGKVDFREFELMMGEKF